MLYSMASLCISRMFSLNCGVFLSFSMSLAIAWSRFAMRSWFCRCSSWYFLLFMVNFWKI